MVTFSAAVRDQLIAPGVSGFTSAEIPDMSFHTPQSPHWVANFFLNSIGRAKYAQPMQAYAYNFLRRAQFAFTEHAQARASTLRFLEGQGQSIRTYVEALHHWEIFLSQCWHAYAQLLKAWDGKAFTRGDGSVEERLNAIYNQMKHVESRIENGQLPPGAVIPVWLENQGLRSVDATLSYAESGEILNDLAVYADALADPLTAKERLNEMKR